MTLILFIVLLLTVVVIHELGHMLVAKLFNVYCHEFSFGMGPKLFSVKGKETVYSVRALPLGGYVAMAGEGDEELRKEKDIDVPFERTLQGIAGWKKILIYAAGIFMNIVLALVIVAMVFLSYGEAAVSPDSTIASVMEDYPADIAGLKAGDRITSIRLADDEKFSVDSFADLSGYLSMYEGEGDIGFTVIRGEEEIEVNLIPEYNEEEGRYLIGINSNGYQYVKVNVLNCWSLSFEYCVSNVKAIISTIGNLLRGVGFNNVSGVVGMYQATDQVVELGADYYFLLIAIISINLGVMNALPVPMLDGGRILIQLIESAIGKPLDKKFINIIMTASVALLLLLTVLITVKDVINLF